ncbi:hypothetical protein CAEBREN_06714 [Caenorhabditis brenneri]|uniref:Uncharacterized protein n=1 Tax=Caenorhabditis brenneri TaxID=135651 RepID=G0P2M9_CAEBE|nr:hypothetical protein CAEBREN_06714 [Caenorhabditis brenneri]
MEQLRISNLTPKNHLLLINVIFSMLFGYLWTI